MVALFTDPRPFDEKPWLGRLLLLWILLTAYGCSNVLLFCFARVTSGLLAGQLMSSLIWRLLSTLFFLFGDWEFRLLSKLSLKPVSFECKPSLKFE